MKVDLSIHAMDRLLSRTGQSLEGFKEIYNKEKILPIGKEKGSSRIHELFYCKFKNQCFISIRDEENFEVITILPIDYHCNIAWEISKDAQQLAKKIFYEEQKTNLNFNQEEKVSSYKFKIIAINPIYMKRKNICNLFASEFAFDMDKMIASSIFKKNINEFFIKEDSDVYSEIEIIFGKRKSTKILLTNDLIKYK